MERNGLGQWRRNDLKSGGTIIWELGEGGKKSMGVYQDFLKSRGGGWCMAWAGVPAPLVSVVTHFVDS